jgi:hypothetical protein
MSMRCEKLGITIKSSCVRLKRIIKNMYIQTQLAYYLCYVNVSMQS